MRFTILLTSLCAYIGTHIPLQAQTQSKRVDPLPAEKQLETFKLADGFVIELVASEEHGIINPIDITFDDAGRLWTQTARMYPLDPITGINFGQAVKMMQDPKLAEKYPRVAEINDLYTLKKRGTDQILVLDEPGLTATKPLHVWADGLAIPQSIYPHKDGCYVAHGSEFLFLDDSDGDGVQDKAESVMSGFGFFDTHTMAHSIVRGPGGWLNFSHGALNAGEVKLTKNGKVVPVKFAKNLRYSMDGERLEVVGLARDNVWGYQIKSSGQWYATSANDGGVSVLPVEDQTGIRGIGGDKVRPYQPMIESVHDFRIGGTGISGLAFSEDGEHGFPAEWANDVALLANPITGTINAVKIDRKEDGSIEAELLSNLLKCEDTWFRPVNIEMGPDGCLYIADFYNKIVSHNEVSTDHPDRDKHHGRIWRVRHQSQKPYQIPNVAKASDTQLLTHLTAGKTLWEKRAAWQQIVDREAVALIPDLKKLVTAQDTAKQTRILALWCLESIADLDTALIAQVLQHPDGDVRREAIRGLATYRASAEVAASLLKNHIEDSNAMVRSQVIRTLEEIEVANTDTVALLVQACKPAAPLSRFGAGYERNFERFLARKALERTPELLASYLKSEQASTVPSGNRVWAAQALPEADMKSILLQNWQTISQGQIDADTFASVVDLLHYPDMRDAVLPVLQSRPDEVIQLTLDNIDMVDVHKFSANMRWYIDPLLNSSDVAEIKKGVTLVQQLYSVAHTGQLIKLLESHPELKPQILPILGNSPKVPHKIFYQEARAEENSFGQRLAAVATLVTKNDPEIKTFLTEWIATLNPSQVELVIKRLSFSRQGIKLISELSQEKVVPESAFSYDVADRMVNFDRRNRYAYRLRHLANAVEEKEKAAREAKIEHYAAATSKLEGNKAVGQALFSACLGCHMVGDQGAAVGPPLDGSANRDLHHLITAIVQPDAAVESAYNLYFVTLRNGSAIEAILKSENDRGITLITTGGATTFIPRSQILLHGNVGNRSFMPKSFGSLPDQTMADLIAYIKTLN